MKKREKPTLRETVLLVAALVLVLGIQLVLGWRESPTALLRGVVAGTLITLLLEIAME